MKISLKWLNEYVDVADYFAKPDELAALLTNAGIEVDEMENYAKQFANVVVGQVVELGKHPDADKLTLCQVDVGKEQHQQIVCGANNHKQGDKVVAALPGAVLPGDFAIKKSKIRGVESLGMLCSDAELGLADEAEGILILSEDAPVGTAFAEYQELDDVVLELSVTPNRADCLSHYGLAREVACLLGRECKKPSVAFEAKGASTKDLVMLEHAETTLCPRYAGRGVRGVKVGPSPVWLKRRLESVGVNSINNVVDVTNFVMLELGQPLHAFDVAEVKGGVIKIDTSHNGEEFTTLDGTKIELSGEELMIRDGDRSVALAGVVGGLNSGVTDSTSNIFIESAHFIPMTVRKTARQYGIETDSAYRFSRGTDPEVVLFAMDRACQLIQQLAGGEIATDFHDSYPNPHQAKKIEVSKAYVEERLGYEVDGKEFVGWMQRLGCGVEEPTDGVFAVTPPAFRWDIAYDVDLVEEYARLHGYEHIPEVLPGMHGAPTPHVQDYITDQVLGDALRRQGYHQAVNYGFVGEKYLQEFMGPMQGKDSLGIEATDGYIKLLNPLSEDLNVMRTSLVPGLFKNLVHNYRHGREVGRLFEVGYVFKKTDGKIGGKTEGSGFEQMPRLSIVAWGHEQGLWQKDAERPLVFDVKSTVEDLLSQLNSQSWDWREVKPEDMPPYLHPTQTAALFFEGRLAGYVGSLHPAYALNHKIRHQVAVAELDVTKIMRGQPKLPKLKAISKFPAVERDFAFVVPKDLKASALVKSIKKLAGNDLQTVKVFDSYEGDKVPEGHRSLAFRLLYQGKDRTLEDKELEQLQNKVIDGLKKAHSIEIR